jgi:hypothetical protein
MTSLTHITGSPTAGGIAVLDDAGQILWIDNAAAVTQWNGTTPAVNKDVIANKHAMCGSNGNGVALAAVGGNSVSYITSLGVDKAVWKSTQPIDHDTIGSIAGDNAGGYIAVNAAGTQIYQLPTVDGKTEWKTLGAPPPFAVNLVAGDAKNGIVIIGGKQGDEVARSSPDCCSWTVLPNAPFKVDLITGNAASGFVVYGEGLLFSLDPKWTWTPLPRVNFDIVAMSGNAKDGVVALLGDGNVVAYCGDVTKQVWSIARIQTK